MITSNSQIIPHCEIEEFIKVDRLRFPSRIPTAEQANNSFSDKIHRDSTNILIFWSRFNLFLRLKPGIPCLKNFSKHICLQNPPARTLCKTHYKLHCHPAVFIVTFLTCLKRLNAKRILLGFSVGLSFCRADLVQLIQRGQR